MLAEHAGFPAITDYLLQYRWATWMINSNGKEVRSVSIPLLQWQHWPVVTFLDLSRFSWCATCGQVIIADVGGKDSTYEELLSVLPASDCRYGGMF